MPADPDLKATHLADGLARALRRLWHGALRLFFQTPLYRVTLIGPAPPELAAVPPDPWPGDAARGADILRREFAFAGKTVRCPEAMSWTPAGVPPAWLVDLHGFAWIGDLRAVAGDSARRRTRELVADWIERHRRWDPLVWRPDVLGRRLSNWLGQYEFFCASADDAFRARFFLGLARQARHLARVAAMADAEGDRLGAIKGALYCAVCLPASRWGGGGEARLKASLRLLEQELDRCLLSDGGHAARSPSLQVRALRDLVDIRAALGAGGRAAPGTLQSAIDRMAPMVRFLRHGDGGLALFNDSCEEDGGLIDLVLAQADARGKAPARASHSGFERIRAGRTLILMDVGAPPPPGLDRHAHAGTLSLEMSVGKERLIVNCGAAPAGHAAWRRAQRTTAAHSTLTLADTNAAELLDDDGLGRRPQVVHCQRDEVDGEVWLDASHDGYVPAFNLVHHRRIYLSDAGDDLRGEDGLVPARPAAGDPARHPFVLRFHLHPQVQAAMVQDGSAALLRLPGGTGWRLRMSGGRMSLEEDTYLGTRGQMRRSQQVVIRGMTGDANGPGALIRWALQREDGGA
ncbi:MAG: heparinase II/III family protein [Kiloniellales bacterium]